MKNLSVLAYTILGLFLVSSTITGCASMDAGPTTDLLAASGFEAKTPKSDKQREIYDDIDSYKMVTGKINGQRLYGYKDAKKGVVYVGNEKQYQAYKRLAMQKKIADENLIAAEMDQETINQYRTLVPYGYWR